MPVLPKHRYIGPGNSVRSGKPVDRDDEIAEEHDLRYVVEAENVHGADVDAFDDFASDWQKNWNWHSLVGAAGLGLKYQFENVFGQHYPMPHGGRDDYSYALKRLSELYKDRPDKRSSWYEFQKLHFKDLLQESMKTRKRPNSDGPSSAGVSSKRHEHDPAEPSTSGKQSHAANQPSPVGDTDAFDFDFDQFDQLLGNMDVDQMETIANPSKGGGVSGHSHRGQSGVGIIGIPRNPKTPYTTRIYRKNWIFFSYGFANNKIEGDNIQWCTPLSLIPVDLLALYMDHTEYACIGYGRSVAVMCKARVKPLGCRMNFQTAQTSSKWATSEFVAIGQSAVGLNLCITGRNRKYNPKASDPMIIESATYPTMSEVEDKLYGKESGTGAISLVPRHLNMYWASLTAKKINTATTFRHSNGPPKLDQYVNRFLINTCIGENIVNYSYAPKNGVIVDSYLCDFNNDKYNFRTSARAVETTIKPKLIQPNPPNPPVPAEGFLQMELHEYDNIVNWQNTFNSSILQTIELNNEYSWDHGHTQAVVQPQVHVGLTAVPAINPGTEATDFQNTSVYWGVECELTVHHYENSAYHIGIPHTNSPAFYPADYIKKYTSGNNYNHHPNLHPDEQYGITAADHTYCLRNDIPPVPHVGPSIGLAQREVCDVAALKLLASEEFDRGIVADTSRIRLQQKAESQHRRAQSLPVADIGISTAPLLQSPSSSQSSTSVSRISTTRGESTFI